jgi:hypothetical protein
MAAANPVFSQDKIIKINNDTIRAKVVKITTDKIIFKYPGTNPSKLPEIHKNSVKEIIYANGAKIKIIYNLYEVPKDLFVKEHRHAVKVDFASPFLNHITIGYEHCIKPGLNLEVKAGIIGPGINSSLEKADGFLFKAGVKFIKYSSSYANGIKFNQPMIGTFLKPEAVFSRFNTITNSKAVTYTNYAINVLLGRQFLFGKRFTFEFFGGLGVGFQSSTYKETSVYEKGSADFNYVYSHLYFGKELPLVLSGGLTAGYIF